MSSTHSYIKAPRLLKGWKWLIEWEELVPATGKKVRIRKTFDLNRAYFVTRPLEREQRARQILGEMIRGFSAEKVSDQITLKATSVIDALDVALLMKCKTDRELTKITYTSFRNIFCEWITEKGWQGLPIAEFNRNCAIEFLDWVLMTRQTKAGAPIRNRTYNNYLINMRSLFYVLKERGYIDDNPFANHKPRKEEQKLRHAFEQQDSDIIAKYVYEHDKTLYLAILLISHCGLRLSELRRLRRRDIDLNRGLISMGGDQTKNHQRAFITIPDMVISTLRGLKIEEIPAQNLIFGIDLKPHPKKSCGRNTISARFRETLRRLEKKGTLRSIEGYTAYSWKDTGAFAMVRAGLDILAIQKHLRHNSLDTTQRYLQSLGVINKDIRDFSGIIFRLPVELQPGESDNSL